MTKRLSLALVSAPVSLCQRLVWLAVAASLLALLSLAAIQRLASLPGDPSHTDANSGVRAHREQVSPFESVRYTDIVAVEPYESFTPELRYSLSERPGNSVALPWRDLERDNIKMILDRAQLQIQSEFGVSVDSSQLVLAHWRHLAGVGEEYALTYSDGSHTYTGRVQRLLTSASVDVQRQPAGDRQLVHFIVPLSGRATALHRFIAMFSRLLQQDSAIRLVLVCNDRLCVDAASSLCSAPPLASVVTVLQYSSSGGGGGGANFSRGALLMFGARHLWNPDSDSGSSDGSSPLLFFCDIDVLVLPPGVERCRQFARRGRSVYFPIVFSEYNPSLVADLSEEEPAAPGEAPLDALHGHWRHYGFGMSCQHASDLVEAGAEAGGMDSAGWGGEDVRLYSSYLRRRHVVRVLEPHVRHLYHDKQCERQAGRGQYRSCVLSQLENEAGKLQLGALALSCGGQLSARAHALFRRPWQRVPANWLALLLPLSMLLNVWLVWARWRSRHRKSAQSQHRRGTPLCT